MRKDSKLFKILSLFLTFLKVGALTFGGGYAMIPIIQREVVEKRHWMRNEEILDILAISESTPGPIAVNTATYIGYKVGGFFGSLFATIGLSIPSFVIILIISYFYQYFINVPVISAIFKGLRVGVILLLVNAILKLKKSMDMSPFFYIAFAITLIAMLLFTFFELNISIGSFKISLSVILIIIGFITGIIATATAKRKETK